MKKSILRVVSFILSMLFILILMPSTKVTAATSGDCGVHLTWTLDENGTLTITGQGDMYNYARNSMWFGMTIRNVIVKEGVTSIGSNAFAYIGSIESVTIPSTVKIIRESAFISCSCLSSITIPEGVETIGSEAFAYCDKLPEIIIPSSVNYIGNNAFSKDGRTRVTILGADVEFDGFLGANEYIIQKEQYDKINLSELGIRSTDVYIIYDIEFTSNGNPISINPKGYTYGSEAIDLKLDYDRDNYVPTVIWNDGSNEKELMPNDSGLFVMPDSYNPATVDISFQPGIGGYIKNGKWELSNDGTLTLNANGSINVYNSAPWQNYSDKIKKIVIKTDKDTYIYIYTNTFINLPNLKEVILSPGIDLRPSAFYCCENLESVVLDVIPLHESFVSCSENLKYLFYYDCWVKLPSENRYSIYVYGTETVGIDINLPDPAENYEVKAVWMGADFDQDLEVTLSDDKSKAYFIMPVVFSEGNDAMLLISYEIIQKTINFKSENGEIIYEGGLMDVGTTPTYNGEIPTKDPSDQYTYSFAGWTDGDVFYDKNAVLPVVKDRNIDYYAVFEDSLNEYEIKFVNEDGTELQSDMVEYDKTPTYNGETPTKEKDDKYTYTFDGWSPEITSVTGDATYTATYTGEINEYEVKFVNEDGTELQVDMVEYGQTPFYSGTTPTKAEDDKYTYTFDGWSPEITSVTRDATYTAKFSANMKAAPPTVVPEPTPNPEVIASFEAFGERLYEVALDRESDPDGEAYWTGEVTNGNLTGADCIKAFLLSDEFNNRNLSDEEFITVLYKALFDRDIIDDPEGFNFWMNSLKTEGRENVVNGFINSTEWCNVCASYGVKSGATSAKATTASKNATEFATRLYTECLGREPDAEGLAFWSLALTNLDITGTEAAHEFFYSAEFNSFNLSNTELVTKMYKALLGRDPDSEGLSFWVENMDNGMTKDQLFENFSTSPEFTGICVNYAIDR